MAYNGPTIAVPESSPSSVSGHSSRDTPATKLTHLSPHEAIGTPKPNISIDDASQPPFFHLQHARSTNKVYGQWSHLVGIGQDPFMQEPAKGFVGAHDAKPKLSATACIFQPRTPSTSPPQVEPHVHLHRPDDEPRLSCTGDVLGNMKIPEPDDMKVMGSESSRLLRMPLQPNKTHASLGHYLVAGPFRYIMVSGLPLQCPRIYLDALLAVPIIAQSRIAVSDHIVPHGMVMLRYADLRCAEMALAKIQSEFPTWTSGFIAPSCWLSYVKALCDPPPSDFEGHVLVTVSTAPAHREISIAGQDSYFASTMHSRLSFHGDVKSVSCILATPSTVQLQVEFYSLAAMNSPGLESQSSPFPGLRVSVVKYGAKNGYNCTEDVDPGTRPGRYRDHLLQPQLANDLQLFGPGNMRMATPDNLARTTRKWMAVAPRNLESPAANHNVVDIDRIRRGQDVRTTIMLRNIPNKVDQPMLKEIVDETSRGRYDFMYLRIDFANNCNVGYAFINFEDSQYIIDFVEAVAGKRWNRFNSDKVAEVSYATIQGKDCLVQKFRNSSVMLEAPSFRPKIFHTGNGPLAGQEEKFPTPDNHSKMRRSLENAEHVGLFAPRVGQRFRDEQRRRRSRYDRGTRLAEIEEYGHEENGRLQSSIMPFSPRSLLGYSDFRQPSHAIY